MIKATSSIPKDNWAGIFAQACALQTVDAVIDCCDQVRAKAALAAWSVTHGKPMVSVGAAGGKARPQLVEVAEKIRKAMSVPDEA